MSIKQKLTTAAITAAMMATAFAPASFAATVRIRDNGALSTNRAAAISVKKSKVKQTNVTVVATKVTTVQNTGDNSSSFNVGGDNNTTTTGDNSASTTVTVAGGTNTNSGGNCCCDGENSTGGAGATVNISGNGALSTNSALAVDVCKHTVKQTNVTVVATKVTTVQNTGGNDTSFNVGGTNSIETGDNTASTTVTVHGSSNTN